MNYRGILYSMWRDPPQLTNEDIDNLDKKYTEIREKIDKNLDYFTKLCVLSAYAHELNGSVSGLDTVADQLTETINYYVFDNFCKPENGIRGN